MNDKNAKRMLIFIIIMGFVMIGSISVGTSFALLEDKAEDNNIEVIETGNVSLKLTEDFKEIDNKLYMLNDNEANLNASSYTFNLRNTGTAASLYSIYLNHNNPSNYTGKILDNKYIKVSIMVNGEEKGPFNLGEVQNRIITNERIESKELINFKMRLWYDETYKDEINNLQSAKVFLKLKAVAGQDITEEEINRENNIVNSPVASSINNQNNLTTN